ncbi:hypothetical protein ACIRG4_09035 [Streptomyces sp. NPDC102395]|uniref:hypothetical protein n=1 Tax=Streptomyces sp. NPDC102395 TaxID=3366168 RepID=UPI0037F233B9
MDLQKKPADRPARPDPEGCLVVALRLPVRIVAFVLVVPVRMAWDALVVAGRLLRDAVLRPCGRALLWLGEVLVVRPLGWLWRYGVVPVARALAWLVRVLVVVPLVWLYAYVVVPVARALAWLAHWLIVVPARLLLEWVLVPVGRAIGWVLYWTGRILFVLPALFLHRWVLAPMGRVLLVVGREIRDALGHAWRIAGYVSLAVGRFLGVLLRWTLVEPARWVYRTVLTPVGHLVRDAVLHPAAQAARAVGRTARQVLSAVRESARQARADVRRLFLGEPGAPSEREAVARREPSARGARTLGSSTTALTKD